MLPCHVFHFIPVLAESWSIFPGMILEIHGVKQYMIEIYDMHWITRTEKQVINCQCSKSIQYMDAFRIQLAKPQNLRYQYRSWWKFNSLLSWIGINLWPGKSVNPTAQSLLLIYCRRLGRLICRRSTEAEIVITDSKHILWKMTMENVKVCCPMDERTIWPLHMFFGSSVKVFVRAL